MLGQAGPNSITQVMIYNLGYDLRINKGRKRTTTVGSGLMLMMHVFSPSRNFCREWPCPCNQVKITIVGVDVDELIKERERETNKQTIWCHHNVATVLSDSSRARVIYLFVVLLLCICRVHYQRKNFRHQMGLVQVSEITIVQDLFKFGARDLKDLAAMTFFQDRLYF